VDRENEDELTHEGMNIKKTTDGLWMETQQTNIPISENLHLIILSILLSLFQTHYSIGIFILASHRHFITYEKHQLLNIAQNQQYSTKENNKLEHILIIVKSKNTI
jgi:hypothetical protein